MLSGLLALVTAAAFAGAAFYVGFAEHPARLKLEAAAALKQWKPAYQSGYVMQASLAALSGALGLLTLYLSGDWRWLAGATLILAPWPFTLFVLMPVNRRLKETPVEEAGQETLRLLEQWGRLHAVRTAFGVLATLAYVWAMR